MFQAFRGIISALALQRVRPKKASGKENDVFLIPRMLRAECREALLLLRRGKRRSPFLAAKSRPKCEGRGKESISPKPRRREGGWMFAV